MSDRIRKDCSLMCVLLTLISRVNFSTRFTKEEYLNCWQHCDTWPIGGSLFLSSYRHGLVEYLCRKWQQCLQHNHFWVKSHVSENTTEDNYHGQLTTWFLWKEGLSTSDIHPRWHLTAVLSPDGWWPSAVELRVWRWESAQTDLQQPACWQWGSASPRRSRKTVVWRLMNYNMKQACVLQQLLH